MRSPERARLPVAHRPAWWMQSPTLRAAWSVAAACWLALAMIAALRPGVTSPGIPRPFAALFLVVAAGKALILIWTEAPRRRAGRLALGAAVGSALAAFGWADPGIAAVELPFLVAAVGAGNLVAAAVVWRR